MQREAVIANVQQLMARKDYSSSKGTISLECMKCWYISLQIRAPPAFPVAFFLNGMYGTSPSSSMNLNMSLDTYALSAMKSSMRYATGCCLDENKNGVCDDDEANTQEDVEQAEIGEVDSSEDIVVVCQNECEIMPFNDGYCRDKGFYYCEDTNDDGCTEEHLIDYCGLDYTCTGQFRCESPTQERFFEVCRVMQLEQKEGQKINEGSTFTINTAGKENNCKALFIDERSSTSRAIIACL